MKKTILFLAAFAALVSCVKENPVTENPADETPSIETCSISLEASAPASSDAEDTKTTLVDDKLVHWTNGDAIKVLFFPRYGKDINATAYGSSGTLTSTFAEATAASARFESDSWTWTNFEYMDTGIALYPSSAEALCNKATGNFGTLSKYIRYELPSVQTAVEGTFQSGINFAYAQISSKDEFNNSTATLSFQNACALIKVTLPEGVDVTSVEVVSANGSLAGTYEVSSWSGAIPNYPLVMTATSGSPSVTLSAPENQTLKAGVPYYIVVWPGTHSDITFNFTNTEGLVATKSVGKEVTFVAAKYNSYKIKNDLSFEAAVGDYYFADGTTGDDPTAGEVVGVVFYKGNPRENDAALPESCTHGLAISLSKTQTPWNASILSDTDFTNYNLGTNGTGTISDQVWGFYAKQQWAKYNLSLYSASYGELPLNTSGWYHGCKNEWNMIATNISEINEKLAKCDAEKVEPTSNAWYWLPFAWCPNSNLMYVSYVYISGETVYYKVSNYYSYSYYARPIFAF